MIFFTLVFFSIVATETYQYSATLATPAVLVREGPSPDPILLRPGLLSDLSPQLQGFWGRIPRLPSPRLGRLLAAVSGHSHCVQYYRGWLDPGWMMGEGTGDGVEAAALPTPLTGIVGNVKRGRVQRSGQMGIIDRDGQECRPWGEGGLRPSRSGSGRPPTMVERPCAGASRTGPLPPPLHHHP